MTLTTKFKYLIIICLVCLGQLRSQTNILHLQFRSAQNTVEILEVGLYQNDNLELIGGTIGENYFVWNRSEARALLIRTLGYRDTVLFASDFSENNGDSLIVYLKPWRENLDEVQIDAQDSWLKNLRIQHFERWNGGWCLMGSKRLYVTNNNLDILFQERLPKFGRHRVDDLYKDINGNLYLIGKDSVVQIFVMSDALHYNPAVEKRKFEFLIRSLQLKLSEKSSLYRDLEKEKMSFNHVFREVGSEMEFKLQTDPFHNCGARFLLRAKDQEPRLVFQSVDSISFVKASHFFGVYMSYVMEYWRKEEVEGVFDPAIKVKMGQALSEYSNLHAPFYQTYWFKNQSTYLYIDPFAKEIVKFDHDFKVLDRSPINLEDCPEMNYVIEDVEENKLWIRKRKRGLDRLYLLEKDSLGIGIEIGVFTSNIRSYKGYFYFVDQEGFLKLLRQ